VPVATVGSAQSTVVLTATDAGLEMPETDPVRPVARERCRCSRYGRRSSPTERRPVAEMRVRGNDLVMDPIDDHSDRIAQGRARAGERPQGSYVAGIRATEHEDISRRGCSEVTVGEDQLVMGKIERETLRSIHSGPGTLNRPQRRDVAVRGSRNTAIEPPFKDL